MNTHLPPRPHARREFLMRFAASAAGAMAAFPALPQAPAAVPFKIGGFTKPFQTLSYDDTAVMAAGVGWDGVELPVRRGGQVLPERVEDDLPRLVAALRAHGLEVFSIATDIQNASDPLTGRVLRTAAKLGIRTYRLGAWYYDLSLPLPPQLARIRSSLRELAALNRELGLCAAYENHSGRNHFGAPVWDVVEVFRDWDPKEYGLCLDLGHVTVEGGLDWELQFRLAEPWLREVYVKDFVWRKVNDHWDAVWCPLGEGMLDPALVRLLLKSAFRGPLIQHFEYPLGEGAAMREAMRRDLVTLRRWLSPG